MNNSALQNCFRRKTAACLLTLFLACSAGLYAQKDKNHGSSSSSSSHSSSQHSSPPPSHSSSSSSTPHSSGGPAYSPRQGSQISRPSSNSGSQGQAGHPSSGQPTSQTVHPGNQGQPGSQTIHPSGQSPTQGGQNSSNGGHQFGGQPSQSQNTARPNNGQPGTSSQGSGRQFGNPQGANSNRPGQPGQPGGQGSMRPNTTPANSMAGGNGRQFGGSNGRPGGAQPQVTRTRNGGEIHRSASGAVTEVRTPNGAVIHHAPGGFRQVQVTRPGGRVVVASAHGSYGYVQRPLVYRNVTYVQRTYVVHGVSYVNVYRPYVWGGISFHVYTPFHYYRPAFYMWAWNPWPRPIVYSWGWGGSPWYGYWGGWFTPYPTYASPAFWLTDYLMAATLQEAYQARMDAAAAAAAQNNYGATPLTPDVKQAIADEVHRQLDEEKAEQQNMGAAPTGLFGGGSSHIFVVSSALSVGSSGGDCTLTEGDVLQLNGMPAQNASYADTVVLASKGQDCRKGSLVSVALTDLQEMQNQMRATIDRGLGDLRAKQGQGGLPTLPPDAAGAPQDAPFASQAQADTGAASELTQAAQEADRAEQDTLSQGQAGGTPPTVSVGMTMDQVQSILGQPKDIANVGTKRIYLYPSLKVTFINGRVSDIQ